MKVIGIGLGRTGTTSLHAALDILGISPVHDWDTLQNDTVGANKLWVEQLDCLSKPHPEQGHGSNPRPKAFTTSDDWGAIFGTFAAAVDAPTNLFGTSLVAAYPQAKFVLTVRDTPNEWVNSWRETIWQEYVIRHSTFSLRAMDQLDRLVGRESSYRQVLDKLETFRAIDGENRNEPTATIYMEHNRRIRATVPRERLLEYNVAQGWEPLCAFLQVPVPSVPFPAANGRREWWQSVNKDFAMQQQRFTHLALSSTALLAIAIMICYP